MASPKKGHSEGATSLRAWWLDALAALVFVCAVAVVSDEYWLLISATILTYFVAVLGVDMLSGWAGQLSFGQAVVFATGAYATGIAVVEFEWPWLAAVAFAAACGGIVAFLLGLPALRVHGIGFAVLTIFVVLLIPRAAVLLRSLTGGVDGRIVPRPAINGEPLSALALYALAAALAVSTFAFHARMLRGRWGRLFRSLENSEAATAVSGQSVARLKLLAFVASSVAVGAAGGVYVAVQGYIGPASVTLALALFFLVAAVIGGLGSIWGPIAGTAVTFLIPEYTSSVAEWHGAVYGFLLLVTLVVAPGGIVGVVGRVVSWVATRPNATTMQTPSRSSGGLSSAPQSVAAAAHDSSHALPEVSRLVVQCSDLTVSFGANVALDGVSLTAASGEVLGVVGANGSGKSTLLNAIGGLCPVQSGTIEFGGARHGGRTTDVGRWPTYRRAQEGLGRSFQTPIMHPELRPVEVVLTGVDANPDAKGYVAGLGNGELVAGARAVLEFCGIDPTLERPVGTLPHGTRRFIEIARAVAANPSIILLDEPVAGLADPEEIELLEGVLHRLRKAGIGLVVVEHHLDWLASLADRMLVLDRGTVAAVGTPSVVKATVDSLVGGRIVSAESDLTSSTSTRFRGDGPIVAGESSVGPTAEMALRVSGVSAGYGAAPVVHDADLTVYEGEIVGVSGQNGAGKTSLLRAISGMIPHRGEVAFRDQSLSGLPPHEIASRGVVHLQSGRELYDSESVDFNLAVAGQRLRGAEYERSLGRALELFPALRTAWDQPAANLSGGQRQMLVLAQGLMTNARLLLVDEPTMGLAERLVEEVWESMVEMRDAGITMLVVEERSDLVELFCDRTYRMHEGKLLEYGTKSGSEFRPRLAGRIRTPPG